MPDVILRNEGTIVMLTPMTPDVKEWFDENVQSEGWQWMGESLCIDSRFAMDLVIGINEAGFSIE